jgi:hypothetical protein
MQSAITFYFAVCEDCPFRLICRLFRHKIDEIAVAFIAKQTLRNLLYAKRCLARPAPAKYKLNHNFLIADYADFTDF